MHSDNAADERGLIRWVGKSQVPKEGRAGSHRSLRGNSFSIPNLIPSQFGPSSTASTACMPALRIPRSGAGLERDAPRTGAEECPGFSHGSISRGHEVETYSTYGCSEQAKRVSWR